MTLSLARTVADAVLYEGYLLYPYRSSARKNQVRWQFGVLGPPGAAADGAGRAVHRDGRRQTVEADELVRVGDVRERVAGAEHADARGPRDDRPRLVQRLRAVQPRRPVPMRAGPVRLHPGMVPAARRATRTTYRPSAGATKRCSSTNSSLLIVSVNPDVSFSGTGCSVPALRTVYV